MTEKDKLINDILPRHDFYEEICLQLILQSFEHIMEDNSQKNIITNEYVKSLMETFHISSIMIVNELKKSGIFNSMNGDDYLRSFVSKICGKNPTRHPTPEFLEALYNSITPPQIGLVGFMEWATFCKIVNYLSDQDAPPIYSIKMGKQILKNCSIEKIKEAIHVVEQEEILYEPKDISDYFENIPSTNLKILFDNFELFDKWDILIWDILDEVCEIPSENISRLKEAFLTTSNSITLKTLSNYRNFIKEYLSVHFENCELASYEKRKMSEEILSKISPEYEYRIYRIFKTLNSELWEIGLLIYLLNNNLSSEKSTHQEKIKKRIITEIEKLKPQIK